MGLFFFENRRVIHGFHGGQNLGYPICNRIRGSLEDRLQLMSIAMFMYQQQPTKQP